MKSSKKNLNHIAIIMDGNRTWSKKNSLSIKEGHKAGVKTAKKVVKKEVKETETKKSAPKAKAKK